MSALREHCLVDLDQLLLRTCSCQHMRLETESDDGNGEDAKLKAAALNVLRTDYQTLISSYLKFYSSESFFAVQAALTFDAGK